MALVFNPFTGTFDYTSRGVPAATRKGQVLVSFDGTTFSPGSFVVSDRHDVVCGDDYEPVMGES